MGRFEDRLRRLEEALVYEPKVDEYLGAKNREEVRALCKLAELLAPYGFDGGYLFTEENRRMLEEDTPEARERDREIVEGWYRAHGVDGTVEADGAKERLLEQVKVRNED